MRSLSRAMQEALRRHLAGGRLVIPEGAAPLWNAFIALCGTRTYHAAGPHPISFAEIEAYCRLCRWPMEPHHVEIIRALDEVWMAHVAKPAGGERPRQRSTAALTPEFFDAVFG